MRRWFHSNKPITPEKEISLTEKMRLILEDYKRQLADWQKRKAEITEKYKNVVLSVCVRDGMQIDDETRGSNALCIYCEGEEQWLQNKIAEMERKLAENYWG